MSSVPKHVVSFCWLFYNRDSFGFGGQNLIFNLLDYNPQKISQLKSELKSQTLRNDLETGKVVVFGSSELSAGSKRILRFMVSNFLVITISLLRLLEREGINFYYFVRISSVA